MYDFSERFSQSRVGDKNCVTTVMKFSQWVRIRKEGFVVRLYGTTDSGSTCWTRGEQPVGVWEWPASFLPSSPLSLSYRADDTISRSNIYLHNCFIMDPVSAVGLVAGIVQFIDVGWKLIGQAQEIRQSSSGMTQDDQRNAALIDEMRSFSTKLASPDNGPMTSDEKAVVKIAEECRRLSEELMEFFEKNKPSGTGAWKAFYCVLKSTHYKEKKAELENKLSKYSVQLTQRVTFVLGSEYVSTIVIKANETTDWKSSSICWL